MRASSMGVLLVGVVVLGLPAAGLAEPRPLFDGKSFAGWDGDTDKTWRIEDGVIVGGSLEAVVPRNEFLCTLKSYVWTVPVTFKAGAASAVSVSTGP